MKIFEVIKPILQCADEKYKPFEILQYTVVLILLLFFTRVKKEIKLDAQCPDNT